MQPTPYVTSLRVYQPLEAFTAEDQQRWRALYQPGADTYAAEQRFALRRAIRPEAITEDGAHFIERDDTLHVCPWGTVARSRSAIEAVRESIPQALLGHFLPAGTEEALRSNGSDELIHIQTETWLVPPRWYTLFQPQERITDGRVRYLTTMGQARKRAARHLRTIREAFGPSQVTLENEEQARWLEEFHPRSLVELDYGGLATYLGAAGADDTSLEDVLGSLAGLEEGDGMAAGVGYQRLMGRWRKVAIYEHAT